MLVILSLFFFVTVILKLFDHYILSCNSPVISTTHNQRSNLVPNMLQIPLSMCVLFLKDS